MPSSSLPLTANSSNLTARNERDEWSWNDWGSLEEQPVNNIDSDFSVNDYINKF